MQKARQKTEGAAGGHQELGDPGERNKIVRSNGCQANFINGVTKTLALFAGPLNNTSRKLVSKNKNSSLCLANLLSHVRPNQHL